jgi:hypothetical protein
MCARVNDEGWTVAEAADAVGLSERRAYVWLARWRAGDRVLADRSSAPARIPNRTPARRVATIERLRRLRMTSSEIAAQLGMAVSTVGAVLKRIGLHRLSRLEPPEPPNRYCRRHPGELIHIDIKRLSRFDRPGHRMTGRDRAGKRPTVSKGFEYCHVAVDDTSRAAYVEILPNQTAKTCVGFLERAIAWFVAHGVTVERIMTDNGPGYRSKLHARTIKRLKIKHLFTPALPATHERKSRAVHPNTAAQVGVLHRLPNERPSRSSPRTLGALLQSPATTRIPRSPSSRNPPTRGRLNNLPGNYS